MLDGVMSNVFPLKSRTRHRCPFLPTVFTIVLVVGPNAVSQGKEIKGIQIPKVGLPTLPSCFADFALPESSFPAH